jgi:hypothetical protein
LLRLGTVPHDVGLATTETGMEWFEAPVSDHTTDITDETRIRNSG